jgi:hypothetical protein
VSTKRPHVATVRLTEGQHTLAKEKFARDRGMTMQKLLAAAINAYVRGDFQVHPDGSYSIGDPGAISFVDDDEAVDLTELEDYAGRPHGSQKPTYLGTRQLAEQAEEETGRRVPVHLLRRLVRERFPQEQPPGPGTRYRWEPDHPDVAKIIEAVREGAIDELRRTGIETASRYKDRPPPSAG